MKKGDLEKVDKNEEVLEKKKRSMDTRVVIETRKPSIFLSILLILIGAIISSLIFLIFFGEKIISDNSSDRVIEENVSEKENDEENNQDNITEVKPVAELDLSIDGEFVKSLYDKIPVNHFAQDIYSSLYDKTTEASYFSR